MDLIYLIRKFKWCAHSENPPSNAYWIDIRRVYNFVICFQFFFFVIFGISYFFSVTCYWYRYHICATIIQLQRNRKTITVIHHYLFIICWAWNNSHKKCAIKNDIKLIRTTAWRRENMTASRIQEMSWWHANRFACLFFKISSKCMIW